MPSHPASHAAIMPGYAAAHGDAEAGKESGDGEEAWDGWGEGSDDGGAGEMDDPQLELYRSEVREQQAELARMREQLSDQELRQHVMSACPMPSPEPQPNRPIAAAPTPAATAPAAAAAARAATPSSYRIAMKQRTAAAAAAARAATPASYRTPVQQRAGFAAASAAAAGNASAGVGHMEGHLNGGHGAGGGEAAEHGEEGGGERIRLRVTGSLGEHMFRLAKGDKLEKLFTAYANKVGGLPVGSFKFVFDGDALKGDSTPADLDLEDEDQIEAVRK
ncbi:unnamed protein product [Closterium sp. Naga37s-1]|nr:unnamed protein product [Closterium sp. Naga37s-1]